MALARQANKIHGIDWSRTCTTLDCPDTHERIICQLCGLFTPFGGVKCRNLFERWMKEEQEVRELHDEYLKRKEGVNIGI